MEKIAEKKKDERNRRRKNTKEIARGRRKFHREQEKDEMTNLEYLKKMLTLWDLLHET